MTLRSTTLIILVGWLTFGRVPVAWGQPETDLYAAGDSLSGYPDNADYPWQRGRSPGRERGVYKSRIQPHWLADNVHFWYRNDLPEGRREYVLVDARSGSKSPAFDHERMATALTASLSDQISAQRLPVEDPQFDLDAGHVVFEAAEKTWRCDLSSYELTEIERRPNPPASTPQAEVPRASTQTGDEMTMMFVNQTDADIELFWIDQSGRAHSYGTIAAGTRKSQHTYAGHVWEAIDGQGRILARLEADTDRTEVKVTADAPLPPRPRRSRFGDRNRSNAASPDGRWTATISDFNIVLRSNQDQQEYPLTEDGQEDLAYGMLQWSPDSQTLVAFRIQPGDRHEVNFVETSPAEGGRARLHSRPYSLPGDKFTSYQLCLYDVQQPTQIPCDVEAIDFGTPRLRWRDDGSAFSYSKVDRGHQRFRVVEVDARTGVSRNLIDEQTETFIWTAHSEHVGVDAVTWLEESNQFIYTSERDGWRHLYLVDAEQGTIQNQITQGAFVVRGIDRIDEANRQIWFHASGMNPDQDPYFIHYYRIDFDGSNLVALTEGNGHHSIQYSPDRSYLIDTYSRVDQAPIHELRRVADGRLVCGLETADISELESTGWQPPEVFVAKGRDGTTDIWGILCRPRDFDPNQTRKYPVIEDIYAGPHGAFVPKTFSTRERYRELTDLGFIVVKIDGMGTAHRSKAFHDVCWRNLKDGGFPDRIRWMQAAAEKYPYLDLDRVGIYGTSAGGQNAAAAVLFHPEFYKAAVANCGCHDNRMDKASWNEQWMGYPVGPWYSESSNIDNAHRLQGQLLLIVGEMDTNVPPESTLRFADALIKAGKDFDLLVVPGGGHGAGGSYGQRRLQDFFVRHLTDRLPPDRNVTEALSDQPAESNAALDLAAITGPANRVNRLVERYRADRGNLLRFYADSPSQATHDRKASFYLDWVEQLSTVTDEGWSDEERRTLDDLRQSIQDAYIADQMAHRTGNQIQPLVPFAPAIARLIDDRLQLKEVEPQDVAATVDQIAGQVRQAHEKLKAGNGAWESCPLSAPVLERAAQEVERLGSGLKAWHDFYDGYDPSFSWWTKAPYATADSALNEYATLLKQSGQNPDDATVRPSSQPLRRPAEQASLQTFSGDAPELNELLAIEHGQMEPVVNAFRSEFLRRRGRRFGREASAVRPGSESSQSSGQSRAEAYQKWWTALEELEFDRLDQSARVDYLLLKNHIQLQMRRLEAGSERARARQTVDGSGIAGRPIGRDALIVELAHEMIPYSPEELIEIAEQEYAWCRAELIKAAREMGFGDDWRKAVEHVKSMHVAPGQQPYLIRDLAWEAIDYLVQHDLVSVPPLAAETWGMQMMTPERQLINPFFTGGDSISVSFPTDDMSHDAKLQSMRGNNIPFARATVHHELIPGHNLQSYMNSRYRTYRRMFSTPFWGEGWALYWEMLLLERGFAGTPEDRIGFLVWRSHRCARIVFSLSFHLGRMTPQECIDYLVANVGFEPNNAAAEVRRSFETSYGPLYQAAYMTGGLQFRALHRELVGSGRMTDRQFHDAILRENSIPVEMVRAILTDQLLTRDFQSQWRFYDQRP